MGYSVLMSVYKKEKPEFLKCAIESILGQTVKTDDFVIVWDGTLTIELEVMLEDYKNKYPEIIRFLKLNKNVGLGQALQEGVKQCRHSVIARMDSDDIAVQQRMEWQLKAFQDEPELALCGGYIDEFASNPDLIEYKRIVPCSQEEIYEYAKKRNPMNHMTVMFRKDAVITAGNYLPMDLAEDYYLWVRMLMKGYRCRNLSQVLVKARVGNGMLQRRGGWRYAMAMKHLMFTFYQIGFLSLLQCLTNISIRMVISLLPGTMRKNFYVKKLRKGEHE